MKIYKISQDQVQQPLDPVAVQEVMQAMDMLNKAIASINASIKAIEESGAAQLFSKDSIINAIQTGDTRKLDINNINQALEAMTAISQSSLVVNQAMRIFEENQSVAAKMKMDVRSMQDMAIKALQTGNYAAFQSGMSQFNNMLGGMTGTTQNVV